MFEYSIFSYTHKANSCASFSNCLIKALRTFGDPSHPAVLVSLISTTSKKGVTIERFT